MRKIAIMQPYFFPYSGYFSLIKHTDSFIIFDTPQFIRHGWIERNRILKQGEGWLYIKTPLLKHSRDTAIKDLLIDNSQDWKGKILAQIQMYKKTAPYYSSTRQVIEEIFSSNYVNITELNKAALSDVNRYLGIDTEIEVFSEMDLDIETPNAADEWALNICKALGDVDEYWNPPGGEEFFNKEKYEAAGIKLRFQKPVLQEYNQKRASFEAGLSIIDLMMFNSPDEINTMLDAYELA